MKRTLGIVMIAFAVSCAATILRGDDAPVAANRSVEITLSPRVKVKLQAPEGWKLEVSGNTVSAGSISGEGLTINFSLDEQGKTGAQKALDDAVRADCASFPEGNAVAVQEIKTKSGHGAYALFTTEGPLVAMHPTYIQMLSLQVRDLWV